MCVCACADLEQYRLVPLLFYTLIALPVSVFTLVLLVLI